MSESLAVFEELKTQTFHETCLLLTSVSEKTHFLFFSEHLKQQIFEKKNKFLHL